MKRFTALLLSLLLLCACGRAEKPVSEGEYGLWFAVDRNGGRDSSFAVARENRAWEGQPTVRQLMEALLTGPESDELTSPFPRGVRVRTITLEMTTGTVQVDLSEQYGSLAGFDLTVADYCIALTLCQLPDVKTVEVLVEGELIPYRNRQGLQTGDVLLSGIAEEPDAFLAVLYFPSRSGGGLTAEYRQVSRAGGTAAEIVTAELLRGPEDGEACLPLPEGLQLRSLSVANGVCQVDLSREFFDNAPREEEQAGLVLYALVNSLCALSEISQVRLLVEGEPLESYGGVSANVPLSANFDLARGD